MQLRGDRTRVAVAAAVACVAAAVLFVAAAGRPPETVLIESSPAAGATVVAPVDSVRLSFNTNLDEAHVAVQDGAEPARAEVLGQTAVARAALAAPGTYRITYHVRTAAGHDLSGTLRFTVDGVGEPVAAVSDDVSSHHGARLDRLTAVVLLANVIVVVWLGARLWTTRSSRRRRG